MGRMKDLLIEHTENCDTCIELQEQIDGIMEQTAIIQATREEQDKMVDELFNKQMECSTESFAASCDDMCDRMKDEEAGL